MNNTSFILAPAFPELFLAVAAMVLLMIGVFSPGGGRLHHGAAGRATVGNARMVGWMALAVLVVTEFLIATSDIQRVSILADMFVSDAFGGFAKLLIILGSALTMIIAMDYNEREDMARFEYFILILFATLGMM